MLQQAGCACTLEDGADGQVKIIINKSTGATNVVSITPANYKCWFWY